MLYPTLGPDWPHMLLCFFAPCRPCVYSPAIDCCCRKSAQLSTLHWPAHHLLVNPEGLHNPRSGSYSCWPGCALYRHLSSSTTRCPVLTVCVALDAFGRLLHLQPGMASWDLSVDLAPLCHLRGVAASREAEWLHMEVLQAPDALGQPSVRNTAHPTPNSNMVTRREVGGPCLSR